ncbi:hypothetical protein HPB47_015951 [Ixodes persulcatus]|uniref:Uncharacterized protein n=1 Tax=Ixodes persulcatus TaxID=34615 RepID=A0AC60QS85_IXOPE|nr:hypothetical protein HPB47_015951 [Ixodes persulcatus]
MDCSQALSQRQPTNQEENERAADLNGNPNPKNDESPGKDALHQQQEETTGEPEDNNFNPRGKRPLLQRGPEPPRRAEENRSRRAETQKLHQKRLPPLPIDDYKVVIRPRDGLNLGAWSTDKLTRAILVAAKLSSTETADSTIRIRRDQNLAIISTPSLFTSSRIQPILALTLETRQYEVTAYLAVPDNSCRGIISGVDTRPTAEILTEELRAPGTNILYSRMMGQTNTAIITFEELKVPHYVYLSGGEYPCRPYQPRKQICGVCLGLGHRTDVCPQPERSRCTTCGTPGGAMEDHQCKPHCVNCGGEHPAVDPRCPARQRGSYNKKHVQQHQQMQGRQKSPLPPPPPPPRNADPQWPKLPSKTWEDPNPFIFLADSTPQDCHVPSPPTERPKHVGRNKSRSSSRSQSRPRTYGESQRTDQRGKQKPTLPRDDRNETKVSWAAQPSNPPYVPKLADTPSLHAPEPDPIRDTITMRTIMTATDTQTIAQPDSDTFANTKEHFALSLQNFRREIQEELRNFREEIRALTRQPIEELKEALRLTPREEKLAPAEKIRQEITQDIQEMKQQIIQQIALQLPHAALTDPRIKLSQAEPNLPLHTDTHGERDHREARRVYTLTTDRRPKPPVPLLTNTKTNTREQNKKHSPPTAPVISTRIWQWNCRGYRRKRGALTQYLSTHTQRPDAIAIQETNCAPNLSGYETYVQNTIHGDTPRVATLVAKHIPVIEHTMDRNKRGGTSLFILNIYSPPKSGKKDTFDNIFHDTIRIARPRENTFLIVRDFDAAHPAWGYEHETVKGRKLATTISRNQPTLLTEPDQPTRLGNSVNHDTSPDLTLVRAQKPCTWTNLQENLGSDHYILETEIQTQIGRGHGRTQRLINWDAFRQLRPPPEGETAEAHPPLAQWIQELKNDIDKVTTQVKTTSAAPVIDPHLLHLWEARRGLTRRWRTRKHNQKLRKRIAEITLKAEQYAEELTQTNWYKLCDQLQGTLGTKRTWTLLRSLIDPTKTRAVTSHAITKLLHRETRKENELWDALRERYIATGPKPKYSSYPHEEATHPLGTDITESEVRSALTNLTRSTTLGKDSITYKMLKNLDDGSITALTAYFNEAWNTGTLAQEWRHADITLIPKPGKPLSLENLRPISLTSCIGKLLEHIVLKRLQPHLEAINFFADTMFGYRKNLSTQDILLQLKEDILDHPGRAQTRAVLALDLKGAFDNVSHDTILEGLARSHCGKKTYEYIRAFLSNRTATLGIGDHRSDPILLTGKGTPQGSIQDNLQEAVDTTQKFAIAAGLSCAAEKSELLLIRGARKTNERNKTTDEITIHLEGTPIPKTDRLRIFGLHLQANAKATHTVQLLKKQCIQIAHLIRRVANKRGGLKETDTIRVVQALLISRIVYHAPYHKLNRTELNRLNIILRTAIKTALGLPPYTSTQRLLQLGLHNTIEELIEAHTTGKRTQHTIKVGPAPPAITARIRVMPLPRNMHPELNAGRRAARTRPMYLLHRRGRISRTTQIYEHSRLRFKRSEQDNGLPSRQAPHHHLGRAPLLTYNDVTEYYRSHRRALPPPHKTLTRQEEIAWRLLQTHTYPNLFHKQRFFPTRYPDICPGCQSPQPTLYHSTWTCPTPLGNGIKPIPHPTFSSWEAALSSTVPDDQRRLIERAKRIAEANGALD